MESSQPTRILVVAHKTAATQPLLDAVRERAARGPSVFTLLVPNPAHGLHKVVDAQDQGPGEAEGVLDQALPKLSAAAGSQVEGVIDRLSKAAVDGHQVAHGGFGELLCRQQLILHLFPFGDVTQNAQNAQLAFDGHQPRRHG